MAVSVMRQLRGIIDSLPGRDLDAVKTSMRVNENRLEESVDNRLRQAFCAGFFMNAARRCTMDTAFRLIYHDYDDRKAVQLVQFHPLSVMCYSAPPEFCVFQELVVTSKPFMRCALAVERRWLDHYFSGKKEISLALLYALCGRKPPVAKDEDCKLVIKQRDGDMVERQKQPAAVTADAVAAARARFLERKLRS